ncbi:MAG: GGDEF domain-containing protein [Oscillospiraceae bacterium]
MKSINTATQYLVKKAFHAEAYYNSSSAMLLLVCAIFNHLCNIVIFHIVMDGFLILYNAAMLAVMVMLCVVSGFKKLSFTAFIAYFDIIIHSILAARATGWPLGYGLVLFFFVPLAFYLPVPRRRYSVLISTLAMLCFVLLRIELSDFTIKIPMTSAEVLHIYLFNTISCFVMTILFSFIFHVHRTSMVQMLGDKNAALEILANIDPLTGLLNRRSMMAKINGVFSASSEGTTSTFSLIIADIDGFKHINDRYGHNTGDAVLVTVAQIITGAVPENASVCRWGGEEVLILLPDTDLAAGREAAETLRKKIEQAPIHADTTDVIHVTMTFGVSVSSPNLPLDKIISFADTRLYLGKQSGKNIVICQDPDDL